MEKLYGGIEAGGTKFSCIIGTGPDEIIEEARFLTTTPENTLQNCIDFFLPLALRGELIAIGIGAFGPLDLQPDSPTYGFITTTPKAGWSYVDLCSALNKALKLPIVLDTDVNTAAIGEHFWIKANRLFDPFLYVTVGTGIGVGVVINNRPLHGLIHPEAGHMFIPHSWIEDPFEGVCPYHGDCLEGLASGSALAARWKVHGESLPDYHPGWNLESKYLALGICNLISSFSPQRIILGGGVLKHAGLIDRVRQQVSELLNGYIHSDLLAACIDSYITLPGLGDRAGVLGAIALAALLDRES